MAASKITAFALDMAWSQWDELGVTGVGRRHTDQAVDLEPLIFFTSWVAGTQDRRLWEEAVDWCSSNHELVNVARLRRLYIGAHYEVQAAFVQMAAAVNVIEPRAAWPYAASVQTARPSGKSRPPDLARPSLLQLRLRALFGVTARAEVIRLLLVAGGRRWTASGLAWGAGSTKANVASVLDAFRAVALVQVEQAGLQHIYRLTKAEELVEFLGMVPAYQPDWASRFSLTVGLIRREQGFVTDDFELLREIDEPLRRLGLDSVVPRAAIGQALIEAWGRDVLEYWAGFEQEQLRLDTLCYAVVRNATRGSYEVTIHEPGMPPYPMQPAVAYHQGETFDWTSSDSPAAVRHLAQQLRWHAVWKATGNPSANRIGSDPESNEFAVENLLTIPVGRGRVFTGDQIRAWFAERLGRSSLGPTFVPTQPQREPTGPSLGRGRLAKRDGGDE